MASLIEVDRVSVSRGGVTLLPKTSFTAEAGQAVAIAGSNGAGKTTLLNVLASKQLPSAGAVRVCDRKPDDRDVQFRKRVAAMLSMPPLAPGLTLREQAALVSASWGARRTDAEEAAGDTLSLFRLDAFGKRFPHELSSGQLHMFGLALTFSRPMEVLLLDEPEQRLDSDRLSLLIDILRARVAGGLCVVFSSHSEELISGAADSLMTLVQNSTV